MGLFNIFEKQRNEKRPSKNKDSDEQYVTVKVKKSELESLNQMLSFINAFDGPEGDEKLRKLGEDQAREEALREAEYEEQQNRRRHALKERGVLVDVITLGKCREDLSYISKELCNIDLSKIGPCEREVVSWQKLTETGKVPKCVAIYCINWNFWEGSHNRGYLTCEVSYLLDGTAYAAWISDLRGSGTFYKIKTVDGKLALVAANPA